VRRAATVSFEGGLGGAIVRARGNNEANESSSGCTFSNATTRSDMRQIPIDADRHELLRAKHIREARQALVLIAVLQLAGGAFLYFDLRGGVGGIVALMLQALVATVMLGLWAWSRSQPRGALVTSVVAWVVLLLGTIVVDPRTALYGGVIGAVVTMVLIRGARAGVAQARLESASSRGTAAMSRPALQTNGRDIPLDK